MNLNLSLFVCPIALIVGGIIQVVAFGRTLYTFLPTSILLYVWTTFCLSVSLLIDLWVGYYKFVALDIDSEAYI